jgi:trypsin
MVLAACAQPTLARSPSSSPFTNSDSLVPQIINGQESQISQVPWQVFVYVVEGGGEFGACGGSILSATTILTAAHCVDKEESNTPYPAEDVGVIAGASEVKFGFGIEVQPSTYQASVVTSFRVHPYYVPLVKGGPDTNDDVAILTLKTPLELSPEKNTQAISLVPTGATPAGGTPLSISGYGKEKGVEGEAYRPNGKLYSTTLTAMSSAACAKSVGENSAIFLCAESATSATCRGDSGGPLTEGSPAVEVGIVDLGPKECPVGKPDVFTNVAAPEIRAFIEGSESPPVAPRPTSAPSIKLVGAAPVDYSPLSCEAGGWNGSPTFTYTFQAENGYEQTLASGTGNVFTPLATLLGTPVECVVQASNAGGVATNVSAATPAIAADTTPPSAMITGLKCHLQACTLSFTASDPNGVTLSTRSSAAYSVVTECPKQKKTKHKKSSKHIESPVCHRTLTVPMSPTTLSPGSFQASISQLPYGKGITFILDVSNAAGLQGSPASITTTLHKPKPKKPAHGQARKRRRKH